MKIQCPECGESEKLGMERSPNGYTKCYKCDYYAKHNEFYIEECVDLRYNPETLYTDKYDDKKVILEWASYIEAVGGDGTLLKAINKYRHKNKPFYGKAGGTVNFLMNSEEHPQENAKYKTFNMIKVKVKSLETKNDFFTTEFQAFNEVCIGGDMSSWINFNVEEKDEIFGEFWGGGMIISTPQGSTGINKNNKGAVLPLSSNLWSVTGDKTNRKINYVIKPRKMVINVKSRESVTLWIDGRNHIINNVESVEISKGEKVTVIFNNYDEFKKKRRI